MLRHLCWETRAQEVLHPRHAPYEPCAKRCSLPLSSQAKLVLSLLLLSPAQANPPNPTRPQVLDVLEQWLVLLDEGAALRGAMAAVAEALGARVEGMAMWVRAGRRGGGGVGWWC